MTAGCLLVPIALAILNAVEYGRLKVEIFDSRQFYN
jgi:hypothetical protein